MRPSPQRATGLATVLRGVIADMQQASKADIVSIFLYEESTRRYFAPFAIGQPQESLVDSLTDMTEQLARYHSDAAQGKVPAASASWRAMRPRRSTARSSAATRCSPRSGCRCCVATPCSASSI